MGANATQPRNQWTPRRYTGLVAGQASITYPNGLIHKFGLEAYTGSPQTLTFTVAFPNDCDCVKATRVRGSAVDSALNVNIVIAASFDVWNNISSPFYWDAWGW